MRMGQEMKSEYFFTRARSLCCAVGVVVQVVFGVDRLELSHRGALRGRHRRRRWCRCRRRSTPQPVPVVSPFAVTRVTLSATMNVE